MIKTMVWFCRRPGVPLEEFRARYLEQHVPLMANLPGLVRGTANLTTDPAYSRRQPFCDAVSELWWESPEVMHSTHETAQLETFRDDVQALADPESRGELLVEEVVIVDGTPASSPVKQFTWLRRRGDMTATESQTYWQMQHGPLASKIPGLVRYVQCHARPDGESEPGWMGMPISWFDNMDAARVSAGSDELQATYDDERNFLSDDRLPWVITTEYGFGGMV